MAEFSVTTDRDGARSFREHDDRWTRGGGNGRYRGGYPNRGRSNYRGGRKTYSSYNNRGYSSSNRGSYSYRGRGGRGGRDGPDPRTRLDDEGDDVMGNSEDGNQKRFNPYSRPSRRSRGNYRGRRNNYNQSSYSAYRTTYVVSNAVATLCMSPEPESKPEFYSYVSVNPFSAGHAYNILFMTHGADLDQRSVEVSSDLGGGVDTLKRFGLPIESKGSNDSQWFKVIIPWGKNAEKEYILKNINSRIDTPFVPTYFHYEDKTAVFYINDRHSAEALKQVSGKINMPNGYKMTLLVKNSYPPNLPMGTEEIAKLKVCMSNRYDPTTKALNLSNFHSDQELSSQNLYMALSRAQVMSNVVKVIEENIPELVSLDLSNNRLVGLEHLLGLVNKTQDLHTLNLGHNRMNYFDELRKISGWKLTCLVLDGNNICDKFNDQASYVSAVRKIFPKVLKLDGHDLPPPITFDIEARTDLPKSKESFFPNMEAQTAIVKFLKDYLSLYDSDNRAGLGGAYHDSAMFSLSTAYNGAVQYRQASLSAYIEESRNLIRTNNKDTGRKQKLLKHGNHIVPQLCLLPKTTHDPNSFLVDVDFVSPSMMAFTVQGVFKEVDSKYDKPPIRAFSRTFATVPGGNSMLIVNDMLTITNATPDQVQSAFKNPAPTPSSSPVPQTAPTNPFDGVGMTDVHQKMVVSFMAESGMNADWSAKCLAENGWDYPKAGQNFLSLQQQGKIPPDAFNK